MNILYLHTHDIGRCLASYGSAIDTPHTAAFAETGATVFRNAYSVAPTCSPSRIGLLTGQYPHQQGVLGLTHRGYAMAHPERHLASWLGEKGWETALCGVQHEFPPDTPLPYGEVMHGDWREGPGGHDAAVAEIAARWLQRRAGDAAPFFLSVGFYWPHVPLPEGAPAAEQPLVGGLPVAPCALSDSAALAAAIRQTDAAMGAVLAALETSPHARETLVLLTTDHGVPLPNNKGTLYDRGTGVAFMLRIPGRAGPSVSHALVSQLDVFPTLCDVLDLPPPSWLEGKSLLPHLREGASPVNESLFFATNDHVDWEPSRAVRTRRYKLIRHLPPRERRPGNVDESASKRFLEAHDGFAQPWPEIELFDLFEDPEESVNLCDEPAYAKIRHQLETDLEEWMIRTGDPLAKELSPPGP